jgi:hypothetical protein
MTSADIMDEKAAVPADLPQEQELSKTGSRITPADGFGSSSSRTSTATQDENGAKDNEAAHKAELAVKRVVTAQDWTGPDDPENPHNWSMRKRTWHTLIPGLFGLAT